MKGIKNLWVVPIVILMVGMVVFGYGLMYMLGGNIGYIAGSVICAVILIVIILLTTFAELKGIKPAEEPSEVAEAPKEEVAEEEEERLAEEKIEEVLKEEEEVAEEKTEEEVEEEPVKEEEIEEEEITEEKEEAEEDMVVCGGCGALVPASSKKCPNCGAEFEE